MRRKVAILGGFYLLCLSLLWAGEPVVDFTLPGENKEIVWSENFDEGFDGWSIESTNSNTSYNWRHASDLSGNKSFATIDPDDKGSMFITGINAPRDGSQEEWLISPLIAKLPENSNLDIYLGYSKAYFSSGNNFKIFVADASLAELAWEEVWDAVTNGTGENPFQFRKISLDLTEFSGTDIKFAIVYYVDSWAKYASGSDLVVDGIELHAPKINDQIHIFAGETVQFFDMSSNEPTSWSWTFEGGVPETSNEKNPVIQYTRSGSYAVSLTASNADGSGTRTKQDVVIVEDQAPIAHIGAPSMFRVANEARAHFVPAKEDVFFSDRSENYPNAWKWEFEGGEVKSSTDIASPLICYPELGVYGASLTVGNSKGTSTDLAILETGFRSFVTNMQFGEQNTSFQMDESEYFPGNNRRIVAYAEYFDKPAIPILIDSIEITFVSSYMHEEDIMSRIKTFKVEIFKAENMQPVGERLAIGFEETLQVEFDRGKPTGIYFGSDLPLLIDFPFFIVVEAIPHSTDYPLNMTIGMSPWRNHGNTAYLQKKGDEHFIAANEYFGKDKHTSYAISPRVTYLVLQTEEETLAFGSEKQSQTMGVSSTTKWAADVEQGESWCRIASTVTDQIDGSITIECDKNEFKEERQAVIMIRNGYREKEITIVQSGMVTGVEQINEDPSPKIWFDSNSDKLFLRNVADYEMLTLYTVGGEMISQNDLSGKSDQELYVQSMTPGIYIVKLSGSKGTLNTKVAI